MSSFEIPNTIIPNTASSLDDNTLSKDSLVEEISACISHLSLDLKTEEESKSRVNVFCPGCEDLREKSKHKNRRKRSLRHVDCILKDMNGTLKHYDSLCSTYLSKTRISNVFAKNECKENSESIERELRSRSNVQKIANGVKTCFLQSYNISEPGKMHHTHSVLIEEGPYIPPNERKNLLRLQNSCIHKCNFVERIRENVEIQRNTIEGLIEEDPMIKQTEPLFRNSVIPRMGKKKRIKKNSKASESYRSEQDGSYSTEDTDTEDPPEKVLSKKKKSKAKGFEFAKNRTGWVSSEGCLGQQHNSSEENSSFEELERSADVYIRPSSLTCLDDIERNVHLPLYSSGIRQQRGGKYFEGQKKEDGLIEKKTRNKRNGSSARNTSQLKAKKRKRLPKKIPIAPQLYISEREDYTVDTDAEGSPQKKTISQNFQNQILNYDHQTLKMNRNEGTEDDIEQDWDNREMLNTELRSSQSSLFNFSSEDYNLQFPKCSSFVLIMGNQLGKLSGISSSMETLCSTNERGPLTETSGNEMLQELSQKMEGVSLNEETGQEANGPSMDGFRNDYGNQVAKPEDTNNIESNQVFNFAVGGLRFDFTPSLQLKAKKIVFKKSRNMKRFLFRSNKGALYLKTIT